jgi:hypothetical protein
MLRILASHSARVRPVDVAAIAFQRKPVFEALEQRSLRSADPVPVDELELLHLYSMRDFNEVKHRFAGSLAQADASAATTKGRGGLPNRAAQCRIATA